MKDAAPQDPLLSVRDLEIAFRRGDSWNPVVHGIGFDLPPGRTAAIVGESGSGKSVTALAVMGLLPDVTSRVTGDIRLAGRQLAGLPNHEMQRIRGRDIGMIFQEPLTSLNPLFSVGHQVSEAIRQHSGVAASSADAEALRLLDRVRIPSARERFNDFPHQFSGGMRQRVMIAMALSMKPRLLIADEPTTALDMTIQRQILALLKTIQAEEGMSILFITHDMGVVAEMSDDTIVMYKGDVLEQGRTEEIFAAPAKLYTKILLSATPDLSPRTLDDRPRPFPVADAETGVLVQPAPPSAGVDAGTPPVLELRQVSHRFDVRKGLFSYLAARVHAVENVSFSIRPGETLSLVGESGSGKTTTGRAVLGLVQPSGGQILLDGRPIGIGRRRSLAERAAVQAVFQDPYSSLDPRQRIGSSIAEPFVAQKRGSAREAASEVDRLLEAVGLPREAARRFPHEFSGGQRQRICIARALIQQPRLIVADEAVSALDVSVKAQIVNLLIDLQQRLRLSYLFISHDMAVVMHISHRIAVMRLGEIVEIGPKSTIFGNPQHSYTRKLIDAIAVVDTSRRHQLGDIEDDEAVTTLRPPDYTSPQRRFVEVGREHWVRIDD